MKALRLGGMAKQRQNMRRAFDPDRVAFLGLRRFLLRHAGIAGVLLLIAFSPAALADGGTPVEIIPSGEAETYANAGNQQSPLVVSGWQGAKNYRESFPITVNGGSTDGALRFLTNNCSVSPATGKRGDSFTVTVGGAGAYSLTAVLSGDETHADVSASVSGAASKADQAPLSISGWGNARDYYRTFSIQVSGGTTNGTIRFETDGCSVSPSTGKPGSVFVVTVTRVGTYSLTAVMSGNGNYKDAYSTQLTGMSGKADQASIMIDGWVETANYGDSFPVKIAGGSTSEAMTLSAAGCEVVHDTGNRYTVNITSVGPYTLTATRAGNYGYKSESAYVCGISKRASQSGLSISGWVENKNVADSFAIRVSGGMPDGTVSFASCGCSISPVTGTTETSFIVTVRTVGEYTLTAYMDGDGNHANSSSRELKGVAGKAVQPKLEIVNWNKNASRGNMFDVTVKGGGGNGSMSVNTSDGCFAVQKGGQDGVYTVTVTADAGESYSMSVSKAGDVNYSEADKATVSGVAGGAAQVSLSVNGWQESCESGDMFAIQISGGSGEGEITFTAVGCEVTPETGDADDVFDVVVTAPEGEGYSLTVSRKGGSGYAEASALRSGSVRRKPANPRPETDTGTTFDDKETPLLGDGPDIWLLVGMLMILLVLVAIACVLQQRQKAYARAAARARRYRS